MGGFLLPFRPIARTAAPRRDAPRANVAGLRRANRSIQQINPQPLTLYYAYRIEGGMPQPVERRLAAILAADVAGYSRLMEADEERTLARLRAHRRELIDPKIREHHGRLVKTTGDGALVEFASVVDAVRCATEIQRAMLDREAVVQEERRIQFRIGINLGDIIAEDGDIFGDGVNIAARLEALAEPGGVCISAVVRDQIRDKLPFGFDDLGEQTVKNIARPVRAYLLNAAAIAALPTVAVAKLSALAPGLLRRPRHLLAAAAMALLIVAALGGWWAWSSHGGRETASGAAVPAKPEPPLSIVVLPFENLSKDPDQEYFADGVTDDLTTDLSRIAGSFVISRTTAFTYKGKAVDVRQIGRDLGVRYVLEGSVRRSGDQVHVNVQLIDAATESHVWADQFDTERKDLVETQAEITARLANTLHVVMIRNASRRIEEAKSIDPDAQDLVMRGWSWWYRPISKETSREAQHAFERALEIDPRLVEAKIGLARVLIVSSFSGFSDTPLKQDQAAAEKLLREALDQDPDRASAHAELGNLLRSEGHLRASQIEAEAAVKIDPNNSRAVRLLGWTLLFLGRPDAAKLQGEKALRLDPRDALISWTYALLGACYLHLGQFDPAIKFLSQSRTLNPRISRVNLWLAAALGLKNDHDAGSAELSAALTLNPKLTSLANLREILPCTKYPACRDQSEKTFYAGLRRLGFPEK